MTVKDENHFLIECPTYTHIRVQFQNICYNIDLPNILTHHNYEDLWMTLLKLFEHRKNSKENQVTPYLFTVQLFIIIIIIIELSIYTKQLTKGHYTSTNPTLIQPNPTMIQPRHLTFWHWIFQFTIMNVVKQNFYKWFS